MKKIINCITLFAAMVATSVTVMANEPVKKTETLDLGSSITLQSRENLLSNNDMNTLSFGGPKYRSSGAGKFSIGGQVDYNIFRFGVGVKFSYDFTEILRFVFQGDYFIFSCNEGKFVNYTGEAKDRFLFYGRQFDMSPAMNFVFGKNDFHFYIIAGLAVGWGYSLTFNELGWDGVEDLNYKGRYDRDELISNWSFGLRAGIGMEYQINDACRVYAELPADLVFPLSNSGAMFRIGASYCF